MSNFLSMKETIQQLLDSDISAYQIGKEAGVQDSLVKKLRNGHQAIGDTKYDNLERLYNYAVEKHSVLNIENTATKLPKAIKSFIENIELQLKYTNSEKTAEIENVFVYDKYIMDKKGNSIDKVSYIEVIHTLSMPAKNIGYISQEWVPYKINVQKRIDNKNDIQHFTNLRITFNSAKLINDLKREITLGSKVKLKPQTLFNDHKFKTIYVYKVKDNEEILGFENGYFDIKYDEQNNGGEY